MSTLSLGRFPHLDAKWAYTSRRIDRARARAVEPAPTGLRAGDLILAQVAEVGHHSGVQLALGRRAQLYPGDLVVVPLGDRYAPDQYEADAAIEVGRCHLVAAGGMAGLVRRQHAAMKPPTQLEVLGAVLDADGVRLRLADAALPARHEPRRIPALAVVGTSMNSGKTTTVASLVHGLARAGLRVGAAKVTGTGAPNDPMAYADAGASLVLDFTDAGYASTYRVPLGEIEAILMTLIAHLQAAAVDAAVIEIADGVLQAETAALLASPVLERMSDGLLFAAADAVSAVAGAERLCRAGRPLCAVSGLFTAAPLAVLEAAAGCPVPVLTREQLRQPEIAQGLLPQPAGAALAA